MTYKSWSPVTHRSGWATLVLLAALFQDQTLANGLGLLAPLLGQLRGGSTMTSYFFRCFRTHHPPPASYVILEGGQIWRKPDQSRTTLNPPWKDIVLSFFNVHKCIVFHRIFLQICLTLHSSAMNQSNWIIPGARENWRSLLSKESKNIENRRVLFAGDDFENIAFLNIDETPLILFMDL